MISFTVSDYAVISDGFRQFRTPQHAVDMGKCFAKGKSELVDIEFTRKHHGH